MSERSCEVRYSAPGGQGEQQSCEDNGATGRDNNTHEGRPVTCDNNTAISRVIPPDNRQMMSDAKQESSSVARKTREMEESYNNLKYRQPPSQSSSLQSSSQPSSLRSDSSSLKMKHREQAGLLPDPNPAGISPPRQTLSSSPPNMQQQQQQQQDQGAEQSKKKSKKSKKKRSSRSPVHASAKIDPRRSVSPRRTAQTADARAAHLGRLDAEATKNAIATSPSRAGTAMTDPSPVAAPCASSDRALHLQRFEVQARNNATATRSVSPHQRFSVTADVRAAHLNRLEKEATKNAAAASSNSRRPLLAKLQQEEPADITVELRRKAASDARAAHLIRLEKEATKNAVATSKSGSRRSVSPHLRAATANARAAHLSRLEKEATKNAVATSSSRRSVSPIKEAAGTTVGAQRGADARAVHLSRLEKEATKNAVASSKSGSRRSVSPRHQPSVTADTARRSASDRAIHLSRLEKEARKNAEAGGRGGSARQVASMQRQSSGSSQTRSSSSRSAQLGQMEAETRKHALGAAASDRELPSTQRSSTNGSKKVGRSASSRSVQLNRMEAETLKMSSTGAVAANQMTVGGSSSQQGAAGEMVDRREADNINYAMPVAVTQMAVGVASRNSLNRMEAEAMKHARQTAPDPKMGASALDPLTAQLNRMEAEARKNSRPGASTLYTSARPSSTYAVQSADVSDQLTSMEHDIRSKHPLTPCSQHDDLSTTHLIHQLDTMEDSVLRKGNASEHDKARVQQSRMDRLNDTESSLGSPMSTLMYLQAQPLRSISRRVTKDELVLAPGALAPGAYRAGAQESDVEDESMSHSDRALHRSESERHTADMEALGELREEQLQFIDGLQPQSFATSHSHQLGLNVDQPPEYCQERAQQSIEIKTGRSCHLGLIVAVVVLLIAAVGLGLVFGLNSGSDSTPTETESVDDNPNCIYDLALTEQCEADGSVSNIPSCVRQRYNHFKQELGLSIGGSMGDCSAESLALLSMSASNQPIYMSNYALSVFFYSTIGPSSWRKKDGWATTSSVCSWYGVTCDLVCKLDANGVESCGEDPERITILNLDQNRVSGTIPTSIGLLSTLKSLQMIVNELEGTLPSEIGSLSSLLTLNLSQNLGIKGTIPTTIGFLKELKVFSLQDAELVGSIPTHIGAMSNLEAFDVGSNRLDGSIPSMMGNLLNLQVLYMDGNALTGELPSALSKCVKLRTVTMNRNAFSGTIPTEFGLLENLVILNVGINLFSPHPLPIEITRLSNLKTLDLSFSNLFGPLPTELSDLRSLQKLIVPQNGFTGQIPTELALIQSLHTIDVDANQLTGAIPSELGTVTGLEVLAFARNRLSFALPTELGLLTNLVQLSLFSNELTGVIPDEICNLWDSKLEWLGNGQTDFSCVVRTYGGASCPIADPQCCRKCQPF